jgi:hypothetical protein
MVYLYDACDHISDFCHLIFQYVGSYYTPAPRRGRGVYCFTSVRPSKIFFVAFFSVTVDGRNLIFGHKRHKYGLCRIPVESGWGHLPTVGLYLKYGLCRIPVKSGMHIFRHIFLSNYWWQKSDIWSQASYRYPILWEVFLDPSDSYFLFADFVDFYTHLTYICICTFFVAFF